MRVAILTVASLLALSVLCTAQASFAFTPHVGDRAAELTGRDVASQQLFRLSEQAGHWVFVDFWAST